MGEGCYSIALGEAPCAADDCTMSMTQVEVDLAGGQVSHMSQVLTTWHQFLYALENQSHCRKFLQYSYI